MGKSNLNRLFLQGAVGNFWRKNSRSIKVNRFGVVHMYNPVDLNYRLRSALIMQRSINESGMELPLRAKPRFCFCFQVGSLGNDL